MEVPIYKGFETARARNKAYCDLLLDIELSSDEDELDIVKKEMDNFIAMIECEENEGKDFHGFSYTITISEFFENRKRKLKG